MINAGGTTDVIQDFEVSTRTHVMSTNGMQAGEGQANDGVNFYIFDSHRPLNLANVWRDKNVYLFVDEDVRASMALYSPASDSNELPAAE